MKKFMTALCVSFGCAVMVGAAYAVDVASVGYVDKQVNGKQDASTAVTHAVNTAVGDSAHPVYVTDEGVATKIDKVAAAAEADHAAEADTATGAKSICRGVECDAFVGLWIEG